MKRKLQIKLTDGSSREYVVQIDNLKEYSDVFRKEVNTYKVLSFTDVDEDIICIRTDLIAGWNFIKIEAECPACPDCGTHHH